MPAGATFVDHAVLPDDVILAERSEPEDLEEMEKASVEKVSV